MSDTSTCDPSIATCMPEPQMCRPDTLSDPLTGGMSDPLASGGGSDAMTWGWAPDADRPGPYLHATSEDARLDLGLGLMTQSWDNGAQVDAMNANASFGFSSGEDGSFFAGASGNAQMFKGSTGDDGVIGADGGVFTAAADASVTDEKAALGATANVIEGAVRLGDTSADRGDDEILRLGAAFGMGFGGRVHYGDADNDQRPEYGIGGDIGPVSFDLKTEDPVGTGIDILGATMPGFSAARSIYNLLN